MVFIYSLHLIRYFLLPNHIPQVGSYIVYNFVLFHIGFKTSSPP